MKMIRITADGFKEPGNLAKLGERVRFENDSELTHEVSGPFMTFTLKPGEFKELTLDRAGTTDLKSNKFTTKGFLNVQT